MTKRPSIHQINKELIRLKKRKAYLNALKGTIWILTVVAAVSIICSTFFVTVLDIQGSSMEPTLSDGQLVITMKNANLETGDIVAFYYNNRILLKRVIGTPGDWINIERDGTVYVNSEKIDEPYVQNKTLGDCDLIFPYQVPENKIFVLGDHRDVSIDSRNKAIGPISKEQIVGEVTIRVWPLNKAGKIN